jgi:ABC-2 type transport system ATP-binding protein
MDTVIEVRGLVKRYGRLTAVDNVSFTVRRGEILGILGPNGAGKTTTLEIIEGLQRPTSGRTLVLGVDTHQDPSVVKERIGVQLQASAYFDYLTLEEILTLFGSLYSRRIASRELLAKVGLLDKAGSTMKKLSGGQRQRFTVAASLVNDPELVILDEPTTGLDPQARRNLWQLIRQIHSDGKTVVLTTHYMEEAQALCGRVAIMDRGRMVALDTTTNLLRGLDLPYLVKLVTSRPLSQTEAEGLRSSAADVVAMDGSSYQLRVKDPHQAMARMMEWAASRDVTLEHLEVIPATLEDVFLELTGRELRD